jgi:hypothetical protein
MEGTSAAKAAHHACHCIAALKALRHPKARKYLPCPSLKPQLTVLPTLRHLYCIAEGAAPPKGKKISAMSRFETAADDPYPTRCQRKGEGWPETSEQG